MNFKVSAAFTTRKSARYRSTKDLRTIAKDNFKLPDISCKIGSLHSFLRIDEFRKKLPVVPEEAKFSASLPIKVKNKQKLYLTMNEELRSNNKKEVSNNIFGIEDKVESIDERNKLLYDKHVINRQKAAISICRSITNEVKHGFGYKINIEEEISEEESEYSDADLITSNKLIKPTEKCSKFEEKLEKIFELSNQFFQQSARKRASNNSLIPGEPEAIVSKESSVQRAKAKEKASKEELFSVQIHITDLFSETPLEISTHKPLSSLQNPSDFPSTINAPSSFSHILKCSEIFPTKQSPTKQKTNPITLNHTCLYLPGCIIDPTLCRYLCYFYRSFQGF